MNKSSICRLEGCNKKTSGKSTVCSMHRSRKYVYGSYELPLPEDRKITARICRLEDCQNLISTTATICGMHRGRWERHKSFDAPPPKKTKLDLLPEGIFKICKIHGERKINEVRAIKKGGYLCLLCQKEKNKIYKLNYSKEKRRNKNYKDKFGITLEMYDEMAIKQENKCAICFQQETATYRNTDIVQNLAVDHCHKTNKIRQLLCKRCNQSLGSLEENIILLESMIAYITLWK